jgi:hypothetical protein
VYFVMITLLITAKGAVLIWYVGWLLYSSCSNFVYKILTDVKVGHCFLLLKFTPISCFSIFLKMDVYRQASVCRFTHFGPYLVHIEISIRSYNSDGGSSCLYKFIHLFFSYIFAWPTE